MYSLEQGQLDALHDDEYGQARSRAWLNGILARLTGRPTGLLSFDEVRDKLRLGGPLYRGRQPVPVAKIVGSVNRYRDFDRAFLPKATTSPTRWKAINRAFYRHKNLPPVQLYKVGDAYFVLDGHNRVSVARRHGVEFIDAVVMEVRSRVPVTADMDAGDLEILGEYDRFLERTGLDRLRPEQSIVFTVAGGYERLLEHIAMHRYFMGLERKRPVTEAEAVAHWYDSLYLPTVQLIRADKVLADFPGRTEADLYLWLMDHMHFLRQKGRPVDARQTTQDFVDQFGRQRLRNLRRRLYRRMGRAPGTGKPKGVGSEPPGVEAV